MHFKVNILYWGLWVTPLLVLLHLGEAFHFGLYSLWFVLFTLLYMLAVLAFTLLRYRAILFSTRPDRLLGKGSGDRYKWLMAPLGYIIFSCGLLYPGLSVAPRFLLAVFASVLVAQGINAILRNDAQVRFWMHVKSCSRVYLLIEGVCGGAALASPFIAAISWLLNTSPLDYCFVFLLAAGLLSFLSLSNRGRSLVAPLLAGAGVGLLFLSG